MSEFTIPPVTEYRIEIERDGAWWDITSFVTRYTVPIQGACTLHVREALPVPVPTRVRISWQQTVPAPAWVPEFKRWGITPDVPFNAEIVSAVDAITVDPLPLFDPQRPTPLTLTVVEE